MQAYAGHKRANVPVTQARRKRKTQTQTEGSNRSPAHDLGAQPASPVCEPSAWARAAAPQLESRGAAEPRLRARCGCLRARGSSKARLSVRVSVRNTTQFVGGWRGGGGAPAGIGCGAGVGRRQPQNAPGRAGRCRHLRVGVSVVAGRCPASAAAGMLQGYPSRSGWAAPRCARAAQWPEPCTDFRRSQRKGS